MTTRERQRPRAARFADLPPARAAKRKLECDMHCVVSWDAECLQFVLDVFCGQRLDLRAADKVVAFLLLLESLLHLVRPGFERDRLALRSRDSLGQAGNFVVVLRPFGDETLRALEFGLVRERVVAEVDGCPGRWCAACQFFSLLSPCEIYALLAVARSSSLHL